MHTCDDECRYRRLEEAHERARLARRGRTVAKLKGRRIHVRPVHTNGSTR